MKKLDQYRGNLDPSQVASGINAAYRNARRLASDARLLMENGRYSSAAALAMLSIEESGKVSILRGLSLSRTKDELKTYWRDYRSHIRSPHPNT